MTGVSGPRLSPLFLPVKESTELGRSLPRRVASATAARMAFLRTIWFTPTGVCTTKVGMPVSWHMGPSSAAAMSIFDAIIFSACVAWVWGDSALNAPLMASRTSGGRLVDVWVMSWMRLSDRNCISIDFSAREVAFAALVVIAPEIALAAIAAALALFAQVVVTSVLGAINADFGGGFVADAAHEDESVGHESGLLDYFADAGFGAAGADFAGGWRISAPRQRWASPSTIWNSCSLVCARSVTYCRNWSRLVE